jgi:hypothetical protein
MGGRGARHVVHCLVPAYATKGEARESSAKSLEGSLMKRVLFLTPLALAAVAGCAPAPNQIQAGQWEIVSEVLRLDVPGATPEQMQMLSRGAGQVGLKDTERRCFTEAEARSYLQDLRGTAPPSCRVSDEVYANGVMQSRLTCPGQAGQQGVEMSLDGRFTNTTFNARVDMTVPNPIGAGQAPMRRSIQLRARRLGICPPAETPPGLPAMPAPPSPQGAPQPAPAPAPANSAG